MAEREVTAAALRSVVSMYCNIFIFALCVLVVAHVMNP